MAESLGKKFERVIKEAFERVDNVSVDRLHDQTNGFAGSANICDFIVTTRCCGFGDLIVTIIKTAPCKGCQCITFEFFAAIMTTAHP